MGRKNAVAISLHTCSSIRSQAQTIKSFIWLHFNTIPGLIITKGFDELIVIKLLFTMNL